MSQDYDDDYDDDERASDRPLGRRRRDDEDQGEDGPEDAAAERAMARTNVPGILLIVLGVLNLLGAGWVSFNAVIALTPTGHQMAKFQFEQNPGQRQQLDQLGWDLDNTIQAVAIGELIFFVLGILIAILTIAAGAMMRNLRGYTLAVICSILVCLPCISFPGCFLIGQVFGIWALVVLLSPEVRSAFR